MSSQVPYKKRTSGESTEEEKTAYRKKETVK
jgi:hypothetical protein